MAVSLLGSVDVDGHYEVLVGEVDSVSVFHDMTLVKGVDDDGDHLGNIFTVSRRELNRLH